MIILLLILCLNWLMLIGMGQVSFSGWVMGFDILLGLGNRLPRFVSSQPQVFSKKLAIFMKKVQILFALKVGIWIKL